MHSKCKRQMHDECKAIAKWRSITNAEQMCKANARQMQSKCQGQMHDKCKANASKCQGQMRDKCRAAKGKCMEANAESKCVTNAKQMPRANASQMQSKCGGQMHDKCKANASKCTTNAKQMQRKCKRLQANERQMLIKISKIEKSPATKNSFQNERYASLQRDDGIALKKIMIKEKNIL